MVVVVRFPAGALRAPTAAPGARRALSGGDPVRRHVDVEPLSLGRRRRMGGPGRRRRCGCARRRVAVPGRFRGERRRAAGRAGSRIAACAERAGTGVRATAVSAAVFPGTPPSPQPSSLAPRPSPAPPPAPPATSSMAVRVTPVARADGAHAN